MSEPMNMSDGRYVLPTFLERTSYGTKEMNPYNKLFEDRIIFLGAPIDETSANDVTAQLLALEAIDPDRDIRLYINSPGGSVTALMAIYDTMQYVRPEIETTCLGQAASAAAILLAAGTAGKRVALPHARIILHQPALQQASRGQFSDLEIEAKEVLRFRRVMEEILARHTGLSRDQVARDIERDNIFTAAEAKEYGLIDTILTTRKRQPAEQAATVAA